MATTAERAGPRPERGTWSPARIYLLASGIFLVVGSAIGFTVDSTFPATAEAAHTASSGHILGVLETNGWHNLTGMISGFLALAFVPKPEWARAGALFKGLLYVWVTVSIAVWGPETFRIASNTADQVLHATLAVTGLAAGLTTPRRSRDASRAIA